MKRDIIRFKQGCYFRGLWVAAFKYLLLLSGDLPLAFWKVFKIWKLGVVASVTRCSMTLFLSATVKEKKKKHQEGGNASAVLQYNVGAPHGALLILSLTPELLPPTPSSPTPLPKETWDGRRLFINDWHTLQHNAHFYCIRHTHEAKRILPMLWRKQWHCEHVACFSAGSDLCNKDHSH